MINIIKYPYCNKVLPLTYDDSLSYYEVLCKVIDRVNEVIEEINANVKVTTNCNVRNFGAKGDGITDDTIAIKKTISYANEHNLSVYFPHGNYLITDTLHINNYNTLLLGDSAKIIANFDGVVFDISGYSINNPAQNCTICGFIIDSLGNNTGINLAHTFLTNIINFQTNSCKIGIEINQSFGTNIFNARMYHNKYAGIVYDSKGYSYDANGVNLIQCIMDNNTDSQPEKGGIYWVSGEGLYCENIELVRQNYGIHIEPSITNNACKWGILSNCVFDLCKSNNAFINALTGDIYSISFSNCWFATSDFNSILIQSNGAQVDGVFYNGCQIYYSNGGLYANNKKGTLKNIQVSNCQIFSNSRLDDGKYDGINIGTNVSQVNITGCLFGGDEMTLPSNHKNCIYIGENAHGVNIGNNILYGYTNLGIDNRSTDVIISNNTNGYNYNYTFIGVESMLPDNATLEEIGINQGFCYVLKKGIDSSVKISKMFDNGLFPDNRCGLYLYFIGSIDADNIKLKLDLFQGEFINDAQPTAYFQDISLETSIIGGKVTRVYLGNLAKGLFSNLPITMEILREGSNIVDTYTGDIKILGIEIQSFSNRRN